MPEALEKWSVPLLSRVLPRHMDIIYEINRRFLEEIRERYPADVERLREMSIIEETEPRKVRMAYLAIIGSHSVNGVAELHTSILRKSIFRSFYEMYPTRFNSKTNGITQRRWLRLCNPGLSELITERIGDDWKKDLESIRKIEEHMDDPDFRQRWQEIKQANRKALAEYIRRDPGVSLPEDALFDCQIKRIHEYKRQLMNLLHVITRYNRIRKGTESLNVPRNVIFAGKAAPGYTRAKEIIKLINDVAAVINSDPKAEGLKVVFIPNYSVSLAEKIIPAADLSEQTSTAGMEASGTGNMKFALNGALTIGTLDGANIEIRDHVGDENIFIFGLSSEEVEQLISDGYDPRSLYRQDGELREALDMISGGFFSPGEPGRYSSLVSSLLDGGDRYLLLADYRSYVLCQEEVDAVFLDREEWLDRAIRNVARMGFFSTDRTIAQYAEDIWRVKPVPAPGDRRAK
jgi:starch phosphorylase